MASLGALAKCRLCLKIGEFYSIFTGVDDRVQLAGMAMACSSIQIFKGDGLPDKICGECIEKLSAAYVFKKQCERCDAELRKSLPPNKLSDTVQLRKRKIQEVDSKANSVEAGYSGDLLEERYSVNVPNTLSTEATGADAIPANKRPRLSDSTDGSPTKGSLECNLCNKVFTTHRGRSVHQKIHKTESSLNNAGLGFNTEHENNDTPEESDVKNKSIKCSFCNEEFKNQIVHTYHLKKCKTVNKVNTLLADDIQRHLQKTSCPVCQVKYKKRSLLQKHLDSKCGSALENRVRELKGDMTLKVLNIQSMIKELIEMSQNPKSVVCSNCGAKFHTHASMLHHFYRCYSNGVVKISCLDCNLDFPNKDSFAKHIKAHHIYSNEPVVKSEKAPEDSFRCHRCYKVLESQTKLVKHLAAHMANINVASKVIVKRSHHPFQCWICKKNCRYKTALQKHLKIHKIYHSLPTDCDKLNKCDICDKSFQYAKSLAIHKKNKHPVIEQPLPEEYNSLKMINCSKLPVRCLHCDVILAGKKETKLHNRMHMKNKIKPHNEYTCICGEKFNNTKIFYNHYKQHDFSNDDEDAIIDASISNFCEVTSDPKKDSDEEVNLNIDESNKNHQSVNSGGYSCSVCFEKISTLKEYHDHMKSHNKVKGNSGRLSCFVCHENFIHESAYGKHMKIHYYDKNIDPGLLICKICNRPSKNMRSYIAHMSWHTLMGRFKCYKCSETFPYLRLYANHMLLGHNVNIIETDEYTNFNCHICKKNYTSEESLKYHLVCHKNGENFKENSNVYGCTQCTRKFTTKYRLVMHLQSNHNTMSTEDSEFVAKSMNHQQVDDAKISKKDDKPKTYKCSVCELIFNTYQGLGKHFKKYHRSIGILQEGEKETTVSTLPCIICSRKFTLPEQLQNHLKTHEKKPNLFQCTLCMRKSRSMKSHLLHLKSHLAKRFSNIPLQCNHCDEKFLRRVELRNHLRGAHNIIENYVQKSNKDNVINGDLKEYQCHICHKILTNDIHFQKHVLAHNARRCNYCLEYFDTKELLLAHMKFSCKSKNTLGNGDPFIKKLKCRICHKPFSILVKLNCHLKTQHNIDTPNAPFAVKATVCDICFSVFDGEVRMLAHRKVHVSQVIYQCTVCNKRFRPSSFKRHRAQHNKHDTFDDNPLKCEHCEETFTKTLALAAHLNLVHQKSMEWYKTCGNTYEQCPICKKEFSNLPRHIMYHEKYKCKKCSEYFFSEILFKEHICDVASEPEMEKPIPTKPISISQDSIDKDYAECEFCFKPFTGHNSKSKHVKNHSIVNYFGCRLCPKKFTLKSAFTTHGHSHRQRIFTDNPLQCRHCGETFVKYLLYTNHLQQVHNDMETLEYYPEYPSQTCLICNKSFSNIHRHYKYHQEMQCHRCFKYILSYRLYLNHTCNDANEDPALVVKFDGDISKLMVPDYMNFEVEMIPRLYSNNTSELENSAEGSQSLNFSKTTSIEGVNLNHFSPIISSTMSLSSTSVINKDENGDNSFEIKNEPIDDYYNDYPQYEFQNSMLDINHSG